MPEAFLKQTVRLLTEFALNIQSGRAFNSLIKRKIIFYARSVQCNMLIF